MDLSCNDPLSLVTSGDHIVFIGLTPNIFILVFEALLQAASSGQSLQLGTTSKGSLYTTKNFPQICPVTRASDQAFIIGLEFNSTMQIYIQPRPDRSRTCQDVQGFILDIIPTNQGCSYFSAPCSPCWEFFTWLRATSALRTQLRTVRKKQTHCSAMTDLFVLSSCQTGHIPPRLQTSA